MYTLKAGESRILSFDFSIDPDDSKGMWDQGIGKLCTALSEWGDMQRRYTEEDIGQLIRRAIRCGELVSCLAARMDCILSEAESTLSFRCYTPKNKVNEYTARLLFDICKFATLVKLAPEDDEDCALLFTLPLHFSQKPVGVLF